MAVLENCLERLMRLESLNPLERLAHVAKSRLQGGSLSPFGVLATTQVQPVNDPFESVIRDNVIRLLGPILVLEAFAAGIGHKFKQAERLYLLGDSVVIGIAEEVGLNSDQSWNVHLEALACMGLIFRFPIALRFGYSDSSLTQVRSNSWGNLAFEQFELDRDPAFDNIVTRIDSVVENHFELYTELIAVCQSQMRPLDVGRIHTLNNIIPIPVVT